MLTSLATQFANGFNNCQPYQTMAESGVPDPTFSHIFTEDFNTFPTGNFVQTLVGTGTTAVTAGVGGLATITTTAASGDAVYIQTLVAGFQLTPNKHHFFKAMLQIGDPVNSDVYCGLIATSATPLAAADGLFLWAKAGSLAWTLRSVIGGVVTETVLPASQYPVVANTMMEVGFHVDSTGNVEIFFNPSTGTAVPPVGQKGRAGGYFGGTLTQALLSPSFGVRSNTASAKTAVFDFLVASDER